MRTTLKALSRSRSLSIPPIGIRKSEQGCATRFFHGGSISLFRSGIKIKLKRRGSSVEHLNFQRANGQTQFSNVSDSTRSIRLDEHILGNERREPGAVSRFYSARRRSESRSRNALSSKGQDLERPGRNSRAVRPISTGHNPSA